MIETSWGPRKRRGFLVGPEVYLVECLICNEEVGGSTPPRSTLQWDKEFDV